jgi:predicted nucleic acid-binding protein
MNYLLDTCVISEITKPRPNRKITGWLSSCPEENIYLSIITIGEIQKGISRLAESLKKSQLQHWLDNDLMMRFNHRIIGIDRNVARRWGQLVAKSEKIGQRIPVIDGLIAATGLVHELIVVTRNTTDIASSGVTIHNPWDE